MITYTAREILKKIFIAIANYDENKMMKPLCFNYSSLASSLKLIIMMIFFSC